MKFPPKHDENRPRILTYYKYYFLYILIVLVCTEFASTVRSDPRNPLGRNRKHGFTRIGDRKSKNSRILTGPKREERIRTMNHKTILGMVVGTIDFTSSTTHNSNRERRQFYSFRGIPYAKPPTGPFRWSDPEDWTEQWESGSLDATRFGPFCPQWNSDGKILVGNEDCLHLNIFTPFLPGSAQGTGLPVLVFVHGGDYLLGGSSIYGPGRLMRENIVLVTINYRLGIFGFLSNGDSTLPGNYGALDVTSALRWVQRHINQFGGDPKRVTLGGFSAGAAITHLHMLSPLAEGLFHGGILMSGSANCMWGTHQTPWEVAEEIAADLGCSSSSDSLKECLLQKDTETLIRAQARLERFSGWPFPFRPTDDSSTRNRSLFPVPLEDPQKEPAAVVSRVPVLIGGTPEEGLLHALKIVMTEDSANISTIYDNSIPYIFESIWANKFAATEIGAMLADYYFSAAAKEDIDVLVAEMTEATTDLLFTSCIWDTARRMAEEADMPIYTYLFAHHDEGSPSYATSLRRRAVTMGVVSPLVTRGISHGDDVVLLFDMPGFLGQMSGRDTVMSQMLTRFWANFIRKGNPQIEELLAQGAPSWKPLEAGQPSYYYQLSLTPSLVQGPFKHKEQSLWSRTLPEVERMVMESSRKFTWQLSTWLLLSLVILLIILLMLVAYYIYRKGRTKEYSRGLPTLKSQISRLASFRNDSR